MNINFYPRRDDSTDRLFSFLSKKLPLVIENIIKMREYVFLVKAKECSFILKGFQSLSKLAIQQKLTAELKRIGFKDTYSFFHFTDEPLYFEHVYYGCLEYIPASQNTFTFLSQTERAEGLQLLATFHRNTKKLVSDFYPVLPRLDLLNKWEERLERFKNNLPMLDYYVPKDLSAEMIDWGHFAIAGMSHFEAHLDLGPPVILHGDVAHHNFLRSKSGKLYLIDFDLVSIGPIGYDLLQYANRILPFMNWSFEQLAQLKVLSSFFSNRGFLYGLIFPSDIFREWNRLLKENPSLQPKQLAALNELTVNRFNERRRFFRLLQKEFVL